MLGSAHSEFKPGGICFGVDTRLFDPLVQSPPG